MRALILILALLGRPMHLIAPAEARPETCKLTDEARRAYRAWGRKQRPRLVLVGCAKRCAHGIRLCTFREIKSKRLRAAACNGRNKQHAPCQLREAEQE